MYLKKWPATDNQLYGPTQPCRQRRKAAPGPAVLRIVMVALLSAGIGQPAEAQGFLKKLQETTRSIRKEIQQRGEQADTALTKAGEMGDALDCLADDDAGCPPPSEAQDTLSFAVDSAAVDSTGPASLEPSPSDSGRPPPVSESQSGSGGAGSGAVP